MYTKIYVYAYKGTSIEITADTPKTRTYLENAMRKILIKDKGYDKKKANRIICKAQFTE